MDHKTFRDVSFKDTFVNCFWQPIKFILCYFQLVALQDLARQGIQSTGESWQPWHIVFLAVNCLVCMMLLCYFYDEIDDWAFLALRQEKLGMESEPAYEMDADLADLEALYGDAIPKQTSQEDAQQPTHLMKKPSWMVAYLVGIVAFGYLMGTYLSPLFALTGMHPSLCYVLGYFLGGLLFAGIRLWRVCALNDTWRVQIDFVKPGTKRYASIIKRILQCVCLYVALSVICLYMGGVYGIWVFMVFLFNLVVNFFVEFPGIAILLTVVLVGLLLMSKWVVLHRWRKFFGRLKKAKKQGEIDYRIEGHPYLSALFPKLYAGIVITDLQRYRGLSTTYLVAICNVKVKREAVIICDDYRIQVRHQFNLRLSGRALAIAASAQNTNARTGLGIAQWYTTIGIEFPEGEGERILLLDPAPTKLYLRAGQTEKLQELDNGSQVYDYTVWTKNAFYNFIERT